ncbi:MAG: NAD(P)H-dependent oxidoreductase [Verrucomicrobia bacterium]|nr:NAD(P)H-dependent oxidoreductase [Verrucomicrobiota bacterium]
MIRLLGISGSLRKGSSNTAMLQAARGFVPAGVEFSVYAGLGDLVPFNPDLEGAEPAAVLDWRAQLRGADGIVVSSPEYAHGVSGVLKNALDWVVGSGEISGKPVALFNASPRATLAQASLAEIIRTMDARLVEEATVALPLLGKNLDAAGIAANAEMAAALRAGMGKLVAAIEAARAG